MPIYSPTGFLDVTNATLRTSNLEAENFKLNGGNIYVSTDFTVAPTLQLITNGGSVTSNTVQFSNVTTGLVVDSNIVVTGNVTAGYLYGDASNVTGITSNLHQIVENGNVTSNTVQFSNAITGLVTTANVEVGGELTVSGNVEVGTGYSDQLIPRMSGRVNNVNITALNERTRTSYATANNAVSTWTSRTIEASGWRSVTWSPELSLFVAVADFGTNRVATSPDGITWTGRTIEASGWKSVTWSPELSLFVAVADLGTNWVATSPDGITWTGRTIEASGWVSVTWSPELSLFVAVAAGTGVAATSPDGITWTSRTIDPSYWTAITWSPELSLFVVVAEYGTNRVATSPDGITWTSRTIDASAWKSVTWSPELSLFVTVADSSTNRVATSPDGITWTSRTIDVNSWKSVVWSPELSLFVAVAGSGTNRVATSPDGITWTGRTIEAYDWVSVTWSPELSLFVVVSWSGTNRVATSNLGIPTPLNTPMALPGQLHVDTVNSRVGIGTNDPVSGLTVFRDIESSNSFITERVLFKETWPNGLNSIAGDLGTWVVTNLNQQSGPSVETTPDGYGIVAFNGTGADNGEFVSPAFDLSDYALSDGVLPATDKRKTTTRVFLKCWFSTRNLGADGEVLQVQFSPDNGSTWYTVATSQDTLNSDRFTMVSADLSPYILETSTQAKIRFYMPWTSIGGGDYMRIGRIWIHESDVPTNLGGMWLGAGGNIGIGTVSPETKLDIRGRIHQEDGRYTFDFENLRPHFIDTLSEFRYVAMMNDDAQYIIPNSGTILYEYNPSTDTTATVITSTTNDNTVGTLTITPGREYYTNNMNPIVFVGGNDGATSSSGNAYNGHHTIVPYIYNGFHFGLQNTRYENANFFIYAPYENVTVNVYINKGIQDTPDHTISVSRQTVTQWIKVADGISANYDITFEAVGGRVLMSKYGDSTRAGDHCILKPGSDLSYNFIDPTQNIYSHDLFGRVEYISDAYTFSSPSGVPVFSTSIGDGDGGNLVTQHPMELVGDVYYSPHSLEGFAILFMHPSQSITVEYLTASEGSWQQYEVIASPSKKASIHYPVYISRGTVATSITQEPDKTPDNVDFTAIEKAYVAWKFTSNRGTFLLRFESKEGLALEDEYTPFGWLDSSKTYKIHKTIRPTTAFFLKSYFATGIDLNDPLQADGVTAATQGSWYYRNVVASSFNESINPAYNNTIDYFNSVVNPDDINTRDIEVPVPGLWRISIHVNMIVSALGRDGNAFSNIRNSIGVRPVVSGIGLPENASTGYIRNYEDHNQSSVYISTIDMINTERRTVNVQFNRITTDTNHIITVASGSFILLEKL